MENELLQNTFKFGSGREIKRGWNKSVIVESKLSVCFMDLDMKKIKKWMEHHCEQLPVLNVEENI